jgi:hypothetical protein
MDDLETVLREVTSNRQALAPLKTQKYNESSKKQLLSIIEKKLKTSFICPISLFEKYFGHLWGHGKKVHELTKEESEFLSIWNSIRTEILNNGNNQIRALFNELSQYTVTFNGYKLNLVVKK